MNRFIIVYRDMSEPLYTLTKGVDHYTPDEAIQKWLYGLAEQGQDYTNIEILTIFREGDY